jgi:hypothetical protein
VAKSNIAEVSEFKLKQILTYFHFLFELFAIRQRGKNHLLFFCCPFQLLLLPDVDGVSMNKKIKADGY